MEKIIYKISIHGCDDSTIFKMELTEKEYELIKLLSKLSKETSTYGCMPTLYLEKGSE